MAAETIPDTGTAHGPDAVFYRYQVRLYRMWCRRQAWNLGTPAAGWAGWHRITVRFRREYDRAEHATHGRPHPVSGHVFRPLWCDACAEEGGRS